MPRKKHAETPLLSVPEDAAPTLAPEQPGTVVVTEGEPQPGWELASVSDVATRAALEKLLDEDKALTGVVVALRFQGVSVKDIAAGLGMNESRVRRIQKRARQEGKLAGFIETLREDARVLAHEGLVERLEAGDWDAIKQTLHGFGDFRTYSNNQHDGGGVKANDLTINVVMPPNPLAINPRNIVGVPRGTEVLDAVRVEGSATVGALDGCEAQGVPDEGVGRGEPGPVEPAGARPILERLEAFRTAVAQGAALDEAVNG